MRVLIAGAGGQLGRELQRTSWSEDIETIALTSAGLDITDRRAVVDVVDQLSPSVIINAAAYTAVDRAERDEDRATEVNGTAVAHLAAAANRSDALLIHVSTDYVFDGKSADWYVEGDEPKPVSAYGRSKLTGERNAATAERSITLRTSWVYGALGSNFVTTMLRLASERDELGVVDDQIGCPTSAADLAAAISNLVSATVGDRAPLARRLYHLAAPDAASWYEVAMETFERSTNRFRCICRPIPTVDYPTPAARPPNSRLDSSCIRDELGVALPPWRTSLTKVVAELESNALKA